MRGQKGKQTMADTLEFTLNNPLTEEQWDMITDVDFDHTERIWFHTKHGKEVEFAKVIRCMDCKYFCAEQVEEHTPYGFTNMHWTYWCDKHTDYENQEYLEVNIDDFCSWAERRTE